MSIIFRLEIMTPFPSIRTICVAIAPGYQVANLIN